MPGESLTSPRRIAAAEKQRQALELRKAGVSYDAIAKQIGFNSKQAAFSAVEAALKKTLQEPSDEMRKVDVERLDAMLLIMMTQVRQGNQGAVDRVIRIMERRAKLLGLDAPVKTQVGGDKDNPLKMTVVDLVRMACETPAPPESKPDAEQD